MNNFQSDFPSELKRLLAEAREVLNLPLTKVRKYLAPHLNISDRQIWNWEQGEHLPPNSADIIALIKNVIYGAAKPKLHEKLRPSYEELHEENYRLKMRLKELERGPAIKKKGNRIFIGEIILRQVEIGPEDEEK